MRIYLSIFTLFIATFCFGQSAEKYSKVRIDLSAHSITELSKLGLETDHGHVHPGKHFINVFNDAEIALIKSAGIPFHVEVKDVQRAYHTHDHSEVGNIHTSRVDNCDAIIIYDYETPENYSEGSMGGYVTYEEFLSVLDEMAAKFPNLITSKSEVGTIRTQEDRPIYWLKISDNPNVDEDEPEVLYTALHHAREPNSLSQLIFFMWHVLENYETDEEIKFLLDNTELYFMPMINPDGYVWNQTTNPDGGGFWRKNRWVHPSGEKLGVDLNRNYGYEWAFDDVGSSTNPEASTYRGTSAFSEPETQAVKLFCESHEFQLALNYHTHGNLLIHPWGFNDVPTAEDASFKLMGQLLNVENSYRLGTGTETVGYVVNGDADDWMYGEQTDKNKIYTYTPEVGPGFWPQPDEIDNLNKSNVRMNLNLGLLTHNLLSIADRSPAIFDDDNFTLDLAVTKAGLAGGSVIVNVTSDNPEILSVSAGQTVTLNHLNSQDLAFNFEVDPNLTELINVTFKVTIDYGDYSKTEEIEKLISPRALTTLTLDKIEVDGDYNFAPTGDWGITAETYFSPFASYTDSPNSDYGRNRSDFVFFNEPIDLSDVILANLKFHAKWDIENDFDYAQVLVGTSLNFQNMIPLCGLFTNAGTQDQAFGAPLYDGTQSDWVEEQISLEDFIGQSEVYIAFSFNSDGFVEGDGFYFDELELEILENIDTKNENLPYNSTIVLVPNPTENIFQINLDTELINRADINFQISDVLGRTMLTGNVESGKNIDISRLPAGIYQVHLFDEDQKLAVKKLIKN